MRAVRSLALASLVGFVVAPVAAQTNVKLTTATPYGAVVWNGVYVGPYGGVIGDPGNPQVDIFCVDYANEAYLGQTWSANATSLAGGGFGLTRLGLRGFSAAASEQTYAEAAWLAMQFGSAPHADWGALHLAIWTVMQNGPTYDPGTAFGAAVNAYILSAQTNWQAVNLAEWTVLTDVNATGFTGGTQEFLTRTVTPEPATVVLFGTGLLALVGVAVVRQRVV